jgi:hypothetical protein
MIFLSGSVARGCGNLLSTASAGRPLIAFHVTPLSIKLIHLLMKMLCDVVLRCADMAVFAAEIISG